MLGAISIYKNEFLNINTNILIKKGEEYKFIIVKGKNYKVHIYG